MAFDILKQINQSTDLHSIDEEIHMIDIDLIDYNENNRFSMDQNRINALSDEIISVGFHSVVELRKLNNGRYQLIAGETRTRALKLAYEKTHNAKYLQIPAYVLDLSDEEATERLVTDELLKRTHTPYEKLMAVQMLERIYEKKKAKEGIPGRIQFMIAEASGIKKSQVGTYQKIIHNALPEVKDLIKEQRVTIQNAKEIASMSDYDQVEYLEKAVEYTKEEIKAFKNENSEDQAMVNEYDEESSLKLMLEKSDEQTNSNKNNSTMIKHTIATCLDAIEDEYKILDQKLNNVEFREEHAQLSVAIEEFNELKILLQI